MAIPAHARMSSLACSPSLLVACDFDGTVAALVSDPVAARVDERCMRALERLSSLPQTSIAFISGRPLKWLRGATRGLPDALLYGSHGAERLKQSSARDPWLVGTITSQLKTLVPRWPGVHVEEKPHGAALHYRRAESTGVEGLAGEVTGAARRIASSLAGVVVRVGSMVVELTATADHKGEALVAAKRRAGATHAVFFGDDVTDEDAFGTLSEQDLGVKVGAGETVADTRVADVAGVAEVLEHLYEQRRAWLAERRLVPLQEHSVLSDHRTLAVVSPQGRVVWLCLPRVDSSALFSELLGGEESGCFAIQPLNKPPESVPVQEYVEGTMVLRSSWSAADGGSGFVVTDFLDCSAGRAGQRAGRSDLVRVVSGKGRVRVVFKPRLDFGRYSTRLKIGPDGGSVEIPESPDPVVLVSPGVTWRIVEGPEHDTAEGEIDLDAAGGSVSLELRWGTAQAGASKLSVADRLAETSRHWGGWASGLRLPRTQRALVERSALLLKGLTYGPSGALLAAATTSLPEQVGGVRNWDYRFCWPRDAAMAATSLCRLGSHQEAMRLAEWMVGVVDGLDSPERLKPLYTVTGNQLPPEAEIGGLSGYGGSRPVRVNNAACNQVQLDVFGPIADMLATLAEHGVPVSPDYWRLTRAIVQAVDARWEEGDHGIWEIRGPKRYHVYSRLMCWHAVDRALVLHRAVLGRTSQSWERLRDRIASDILNNGWNEEAGAFSSAYGYSDLDATGLLVGLTGLIKTDDPRWVKTVDAIQRDLQRGQTPGPVSLLRYACDDGLPGREGGFVICTCWLIESLITLGRIDEAASMLESVSRQAGRTGVLTEQFDATTGDALGNLPQAYSHLGFINAALRLDAVTTARV